MTARRIAVVTAGLSNPSTTRLLADRLADAATRGLVEAGESVEVDVFELRDYAHDVTNNLLTGFAPPALASMIDAVTSADGLIVVTPIFSTSYSGLFKSFIDVIDPDALTGMPVLIGANAGTARHSLAIDYAIRPLFAYLHAEAISTGVFAASSDWGGTEDGAAQLASRIDRAGREFAAAVARRERKAAVDLWDPASFLGEGRSFGHLLGGLAGE
ncbi:FMN reductase [Protaetiibacter larvae]|uniref:NADPH-dependent FMN reductase n=1 Tax=Protaetiibacter larvae TaxID=2592654 RepID=A0A5C1Y7M5_9MICO|nr:FMN reductase [Protaetiibacter larvae]QEO09841.1 NADPH-dependent FMN reductase [Protaetiibacter larvae]